MQGIHGGDIYRNKVNIDFSVNINPLGMPEGLREALYNAVAKCQEYPDMEAVGLKHALGSLYNISEDCFLFGSGASEIFMGIVHALKPRKILIPVPSFYGYEYAANAVESDIVYFQLKEENEFTFQDGFFEVLTEDIDILFIANPNNPTGKRIDKDYLKKVLEICLQKNIYVVLDECFIEFCGNEYSMLSEIDKYDNLLIVRAFTKIYSIPGVRLGYLVTGNRQLLKQTAGQMPEWNISTFAQEAGVVCAGQTEYVARTVEYLKKERLYLTEGLRSLGMQVFDSEANFLFVYCEDPLYDELLKHGILIRNCENYKGLSKGYYRIAVKRREDNEVLLSMFQ